jgi:hypothetical protein
MVVEELGVKWVAKRSNQGCVFCKVPLCLEGNCWARYYGEYHHRNAD